MESKVYIQEGMQECDSHQERDEGVRSEAFIYPNEMCLLTLAVVLSPVCTN